MAAEMFGPYRLTSRLGAGGMGEVWRAVDTRKGRTVAVKVLGGWLARDGDFAARFRREAALTAQLNSPNVIPIHDYGEIDGRLFLEMPLIDGRDLATVLERSGPLLPARAIGIAAQVGRALAVAHHGGLVHRDVKPSNILITGEGDDEHVYLIDFGISRALDGTRLSLSGAVIGTPAYMAPERFAGEGDARSDLYALGCVLYQMLTDELPFAATNPLVLMNAHLNDPPPRPSAARPSLPHGLDDVVVRAMAKNPAQRYAMVGDLVTAARAAVVAPPTPPTAHPPPERVAPPTVVTMPPLPPGPATRVRVVDAIAVVAVVAMTAADVTLALQYGESSSPMLGWVGAAAAAGFVVRLRASGPGQPWAALLYAATAAAFAAVGSHGHTIGEETAMFEAISVWLELTFIGTALGLVTCLGVHLLPPTTARLWVVSVADALVTVPAIVTNVLFQPDPVILTAALPVMAALALARRAVNRRESFPAQAMVMAAALGGVSFQGGTILLFVLTTSNSIGIHGISVLFLVGEAVASVAYVVALAVAWRHPDAGSTR